MNCGEARESLLTADLACGAGHDLVTMQNPELELHIAGCEECNKVRSALCGSEKILSESLSAIPVRNSAEEISRVAYQARKRRRLVNWLFVPGGLIVLVVVAMLAYGRAAPVIRNLTAPPPALEVQTFSLQCLSAEQAASLIRPYLPHPRNPMWQAEDFDVRQADGGLMAVTVRAPKEVLRQIPELLKRYEADPSASCQLPGGRK